MRQKIFMGLSCVHAINLIIQTVSFASYISCSTPSKAHTICQKTIFVL